MNTEKDSQINSRTGLYSRHKISACTSVLACFVHTAVPTNVNQNHSELTSWYMVPALSLSMQGHPTVRC